MSKTDLHQNIINRVRDLSKKDREIFFNSFKEMSVDSIIKKGLKQTYKASKRNHIKFAILVDPQNLNNKSLLDPFLNEIIQNRIPFFYVSSLKEITKLLNKEFSCTCTGLLQISKRFDGQLKEFSNLIYNHV